MSILYGILVALVLVVGMVVVLVGWFRNKNTTTATGAATTPTTSRWAISNPLVRQFGTVLLVVVVLWIVGSLVNQKIDNPMPYTIAFVLGALQYFTGSKKGNIKLAMSVTVLGVVMIWFWLHPQVFVGIAQATFGPFGGSDLLSTWTGSDVSTALNVIMIGIVVWSLWVTGDFFGMLFIIAVMFFARMMLGV